MATDVARFTVQRRLKALGRVTIGRLLLEQVQVNGGLVVFGVRWRIGWKASAGNCEAKLKAAGGYLPVHGERVCSVLYRWHQC